MQVHIFLSARTCARRNLKQPAGQHISCCVLLCYLLCTDDSVLTDSSFLLSTTTHYGHGLRKPPTFFHERESER